MTLPSTLPDPANPRQAWADYITRIPEIVGLPYEYWGTLTYRDHADIPRHHQADIVAKRFRWFTGEINKVVYGKRWIRSGKGIFGAVATEKIPDFPHHHFIVGGEGLRLGIKRLEIMDMWHKHFGIARCQDYKGQAAPWYITKYVSKGGIVDVFAAPRDRDKLKPI